MSSHPPGAIPCPQCHELAFIWIFSDWYACLYCGWSAPRVPVKPPDAHLGAVER